MTLDTSTTARASLDQAWRALTDVTSWPEWTPSITSVRRLDDGPLRIGSRARVKQPGYPPMVWQVTEVRDADGQAGFTWVTHSPGVHTTGRHTLTANPDGTTRITLEIDHQGALSGLVGALTRKRTEAYLELEAAGLAAASEAIAR
jgi:uncharacterized membrane protein